MVREPDFWNQDEVQEGLIETLGFLSGDNYEFDFIRFKNIPHFPDYLAYNEAAGLPDPVQRVILFSGGLDSLTGAVQDVLVHRRRIAMVSHKPVDHLAVKQRRLVAEITHRADDSELKPLHFPVKANKIGELSIDHTQRSRSFLYASMAMAVAHYFHLNSIHFYENGILSVNLPLCQQEVSTRATRTTHPQVFDGFGRIFALVTGHRFTVNNELFWQTKQDVLEILKNTGHVDLARDTLSCTHTRGFTLAAPHCGLCSQCVSRRIAALGADYGENDPASGYRADVVLAARTKDEDRIMAERFIGSARQIEDMASVDEFHQAHAAELGRATPYLGLSAQTAVERLFDLHHRHARQVGEVMRKQMTIQVDARWRGRLADTCMLNYVFDAGRSPRSAEGVIPSEGEHTRSPSLSKVDIGEPGLPSFVNGRQKKPLTDGQRAVVVALMKAGSDGMTKDSVESIRPSARQILKTLRADSDWATVILMPQQTNGRYRIRA